MIKVNENNDDEIEILEEYEEDDFCEKISNIVPRIDADQCISSFNVDAKMVHKRNEQMKESLQEFKNLDKIKKEETKNSIIEEKKESVISLKELMLYQEFGILICCLIAILTHIDLSLFYNIVVCMWLSSEKKDITLSNIITLLIISPISLTIIFYIYSFIFNLLSINTNFSLVINLLIVELAIIPYFIYWWSKEKKKQK